jgi:signal transduction histidine kinase
VSGTKVNSDHDADAGFLWTLTDGSKEKIFGQLAAWSITAIGFVMLATQVYDIWNNVITLDWFALMIFAENFVLMVLAVLLIIAGGWLARQDWQPSEKILAAKWTIGGAVALSGTYAVVILIQMEALGYIRPYVLVADGIVMGSVAAFGIGLYDVYRRQSRRDLVGERDRFLSFFESTDVRIVTLDHDDGELDAGEENPAFDETFTVNFDALLDAAEPTEDSAFDRDQFVQSTIDGEHYHEEIRVPAEKLTPEYRAVDETLTEGRFFDLRTVQVADDESFAVLPDITAQRERERLLGERTERLARQKSEREQELEERTQQLKFLHSLLRHDVQNGMMVIDSRAEFLSNELDGRKEEFAETIVSRAGEISEQIDRIRTALDTLTEGTDTDTVNVSSLLEERVASFRDNYPAVEVKANIEDGLRAEADNILDDVLANLLRNAVEHNDKEHVVAQVTATAGPDCVRIEVADNGPGIPEEHHDKVFRRGVSGANDGGPGGSGFGLFFIDTMVESYGGDIRIEDNEPEGARFVIELPYAEDEFGG